MFKPKYVKAMTGKSNLPGKNPIWHRPPRLELCFDLTKGFRESVGVKILKEKRVEKDEGLQEH